MARCDKSEHLYRIRARIFCDCTGDSRLALEAGADLRTGREARSEFDEPLAPESPDNRTLGSSILFTSRLFHTPMPFTPPKWARKITKAQLLHRGITSWEYGYWWIEWGGDKDIIADNERIRFELLSIVMGVWDYIKNSGEFPDSRYWAMDWVGMMPGKRGSRRLLGDYVLTQHDLMKGSLPDAVAIGGWPMDAHPPEGFDRPDLPPNTTLKPPEVYDIPLRSLYSRNIRNLFMAGRNISASYVAFTSARVMATCAVEGQAIGTAAARCVEAGITPRELAGDAKQVARLQETLLRDDQTIKGRGNRDPLDLARVASVNASAEEGNAKAALVLDGFTRDIPDAHGEPVVVHHWAAPVAAGEPAWIELRLVETPAPPRSAAYLRQRLPPPVDAQRPGDAEHQFIAGPATGNRQGLRSYLPHVSRGGSPNRFRRGQLPAAEPPSLRSPRSAIASSGSPLHEWRPAGAHFRNSLLRIAPPNPSPRLSEIRCLGDFP